jgi:3-oxoacyl-(acyl-carrier-protein) synthase
LKFRRRQIAQWLENERELLKLEVESVPVENKDDFLRERIALIESESVRQEKDSLATFGMLAGQDDRIAPIRRALAVWGLTLDDLGVVSIHGTSTQANEKNETSVYNDVFTNIGRTPGNAVPVIAQKNMTGKRVEFLDSVQSRLTRLPRPS